MNRTVRVILALVSLAALAVWMPAAAFGAAAEAPAAGGPGALPAGHPPLPKGHPPLPTGHPSALGDVPAMPPDAKGALVVQAVQGTRKGPAIGADPVVVELVREGEVVKRIETKLDDKGQAILENLPAGQIVQPVVRVRHGGADYQAVGDTMHAGPPDQRITVVVYESTEEAPAWVIRARHVFVRRTEEGLYVKEMMIVESPTDRAWVGKTIGGGERATLSLPLSKNTGRVDFYAGFFQGGTELKNSQLINHIALAPGTTKFQFGYVVPIEGGKAAIEIAIPADTDQLVLMLPDDGAKASVTGLTGGDPVEMGPQKMRLYKADKLKAGHRAAVVLSGLKSAAAAATPAPKPRDGASALPQTLAAVGGGAIVVGGLGAVCFRWLKSSPRSA